MASHHSTAAVCCISCEVLPVSSHQSTAVVCWVCVVKCCLSLGGCRDQFQVDLQPEWVYELDSSHAGKFSRHLILRIPGIAFVNNWAVGHLVSQILAEPEVGLTPVLKP